MRAWLQPSEKRGPDEPTVFRRGSAGATPGQIVREADSAAAIRCLSCCTAGRWCKVVVWRNPPTESVHIVGLVSFDGERLWVYAGAREIAEMLLRALAVKVLACVETEDSDGYTWDVFDAAPGTAEHFEALEDASPPPLRPLGLRLISVARTDIPLPTFKACVAYPDAGEES